MLERTSKDNRLIPLTPGILALTILASSVFLPFAGPLFLPFLPAPLAYARLRYGFANFAVVSALCLAVFTLTGGYPVASSVAVGLCVMGYSLGGSLKAKEADGTAVLKGALLPVITVAPLLGLYFLSAGVDPWSALKQSLDQGLKESIALYRRMGMSQADIDTLVPTLHVYINIIIDYLPALSICVMGLVSFVCYFLVRRHASRVGALEGVDAPMNRWHAPDGVVWGLIIPGFLMVPPYPVLRQAAGNVLAVFAMAYLFQGMAVTAYFFERLKLPPWLKALGLLIIALQPFLLLVMWGVGLFDTWGDFRKVRPK